MCVRSKCLLKCKVKVFAFMLVYTFYHLILYATCPHSDLLPFNLTNKLRVCIKRDYVLHGAL